jgi:pre-mRNA-processing factor SLU7
MTHATKDCLERPRTKGAKWTNKNIAADDKVEDIKLSTWDAKRDRWNGFDAKDYNKVVERYEQVRIKDNKSQVRFHLLILPALPHK